LSVVIDASTVVAALVDAGPDGEWAEQLMEDHEVIAPSLILVECTSDLKRLKAAQKINDLNASIARRNLLLLPVSLFSFEPFADRVWALRENLSSYDVWYVSVAEALQLPLATLDMRLVNAPGPECHFMFRSD